MKHASGLSLVGSMIVASLATLAAVASGCGGEGDDGTTRQAGNGGASSGAGGSGVGMPMDAAGDDDAVADAGIGEGSSGTRFSFFVTSLAGMQALSGSPNGFGGDLRFGKATGLEGADEICRQLAERSMPGNGKEWRAFLSVLVGPNGTPVNAIDRIGEGPWYDRHGRLFSSNKASLSSGARRPTGADPAILNDLPNEDGVPNHAPEGVFVDNHHIMTGSTTTGTLHTSGAIGTCRDWTTTVGSAGKPRCGFSWPRILNSTQSNGTHWISGIDEWGCAAVVAIHDDAPRSMGVGAIGGYGGIYCFALTP